MKKVKVILHDTAAFIVGLTAAMLLFVLLYSIGLTALGIDPACAEETTNYPVAAVMVNADSYLNIRQTPGGKLTGSTLECHADVVILAEDSGWALVIRPENVGSSNMNGNPLGWVSMDYLKPYRTFVAKENGK